MAPPDVGARHDDDDGGPFLRDSTSPSYVAIPPPGRRRVHPEENDDDGDDDDNREEMDVAEMDEMLAASKHAYDEDQRLDVTIFDSDGDRFAIGDDDTVVPKFSWRKLWAFTGPGFLMSIAYLDPGNLESDLQAGSQAGYQLLWLLMWATVMGLFIQLLAARLGVATGRHLAELCRERYPRPISYVLWIMAEIAIVGSDIQEVMGSAIAFNILSFNYLPIWAGVLITTVDSFLLLFLEDFGVRKLEAFFAGCIAVMVASFVGIFATVSPDPVKLTEGLLIPYISGSAVKQAVGIIGAVIMPHNIFLHSAVVQSRKIENRSPGRVKEALRYYTIESAGALLVSFLINMSVMSIFAKVFSGQADASSIGLVNAGQKLAEKFPEMGTTILLVWGVGLLAAGQSSTMTGTYAGQFVMAGFLDLPVSRWLRAMITRSVAIGPTLFVAVVCHASPHKLDSLSAWLNVLQSFQLPFAVIPLLKLSSSDRTMGAFKLRMSLQALAWAVALLVISINGYLLVDFITERFGAHFVAAYMFIAVFAALYLAFMIILGIGPRRAHHVINSIGKTWTSLRKKKKLLQRQPGSSGRLGDTAGFQEPLIKPANHDNDNTKPVVAVRI